MTWFPWQAGHPNYYFNRHPYPLPSTDQDLRGRDPRHPPPAAPEILHFTWPAAMLMPL